MRPSNIELDGLLILQAYKIAEKHSYLLKNFDLWTKSMFEFSIFAVPMQCHLYGKALDADN